MARGNERWETLGSRVLLECPIFTVAGRRSAGPHGKEADFITLDAPDWAVVVPVLEAGGVRSLLAVRQYRHGSGEVSVEFPGGVVEPGEDPAAAAARELLEETGYRAARIVPIGDCSPNPAFMRNRFRVFAAEGLKLASEQSLDEHELIDVECLPEDEVLAAVGTPPWSHALMVAAAWYYVRWRALRPA